MIFCFSSKNKWPINDSCFEYCTLYYDVKNKSEIAVMDSDLYEFKEKFSDELQNNLLIEIFRSIS